MVLTLQSGISYCVIDGNALFLDLPRDRYFRLSSAASPAFQTWHEGRMPTDADRGILEAAGILGGGPHAANGFELPSTPVRRRHDAIASGAFDLSEVARALWMQRKVERRLRAYGLLRMVNDIRALRSTSACGDLDQSQAGGRVLRAFEVGRLLRPSAEKCLPRSIAVALCLARHGIAAKVVLGVKLGPFAAHAWAQANDAVLNDTMEEVARFTPILVV